MTKNVTETICEVATVIDKILLIITKIFGKSNVVGEITRYCNDKANTIVAIQYDQANANRFTLVVPVDSINGNTPRYLNGL